MLNEFGTDVQKEDFVRFAFLFQKAWDPCPDVRARALTSLFETRQKHLRKLQELTELASLSCPQQSCGRPN